MTNYKLCLNNNQFYHTKFTGHILAFITFSDLGILRTRGAQRKKKGKSDKSIFF